MPTASEAIIFDVDGVLLDSLPQHLQICVDKAREYGLAGLAVPDSEGMRRMIAGGVRVSPMRNFFLAVGFSPAQADRAVADYEREFMQRYRPRAFAGIGPMLMQLRDAGRALGLVTANIRSNVEPALGAALELFDPRCRFYFDTFEVPRSKVWCLEESARVLGVAPADCTYVGDQPADLEAANASRMRFLGVTYGWGLTRGTHAGIALADRVDAIAPAILGL
jgi:phosphoglycolate phosphatase-like HAD superfamily hydrolase